jgi:hypothetical protein
MVLQEVMRMDYTGNVGIGQEPTQKLDVNGQIRMRTGATTGYIPVSDVNGTMTWTNPSTIVGTQAWKLTGNSGTVPGTNFIGTTDNVDFRIRTNNTDKVTIASSGNVGIGNTNPLQKLHVAGKIWANDGSSNVFVGENSGAASTTSYLNTAVGFDALSSITTSGDNTAIGYRNMRFLTTGGSNSSIGSYAMHALTTGGSNVALGYGALNSLEDGNNNVAIGRAAGSGNINGSGNIFIGFRAGDGSTGSNELYIDNSNTASPLIFGNFTSNIINVNGSLGINTATPGQRLDVNGDARIQNGTVHIWALNATEGGQINLADGNNDADGQPNAWSLDVSNNDFRIMDDGAVRAFFQDDGNLGIGTTVPAQKLDVNGKIQMRTGATTGYIPVSDANGTMTWTNPSTITTAYVDEIRDADNDTKVQVEESADEDKIRFDTFGSERMIIDNTGNVGIGLSSPTERLHISNANLLLSGSGTTVNGIQLYPKSGTGNSGGRIYFREDNNDLFGFSMGYNGGNTGNEILNWPANSFNISRHGNDATGTVILHINGSTNVGIGTTSPVAKLDVSGAFNASGGGTFGNNVQITGNYYLDNTSGTGSNNPPFRVDGFNDILYVAAESNGTGPAGGTEIRLRTATGATTAVDRMTIDNNGNVGVGVTAPSTKLHVQTTGTGLNLPIFAQNTTANDAGGTAVGIGFSNETSASVPPKAAIVHERNANYARGSMHFVLANYTNNNAMTLADTKMTLTKEGNLGIGTTAPAQVLDVNGKIQMRTGATTGYIPVSDANGTMTWTDPATITTAYVDEIRDADNDTKVQVEESADEDIIRFDAAGTQLFSMRKLAAGSPWLEVNSSNTLIGNSISSAINNAYNTAVGYQSAQSLTSGQKNTYYGDNAGGFNTTGSNNTMLGTVAGQFNDGGSNNTMVGGYAGRSNLTGSGNVFLGFGAGENETGSNKLYIDNSSTASPLIYGDFNSNILGFNGNVGVGLDAPVNKLDVEGGLAVGAGYSGTNTAPANGMIVQGNVGIGTNAPTNLLQVNTTTAGRYAYYHSIGSFSVINPETFTGEVRLGAAWGRPGLYSSAQLELQSSNTGIVFGNNDVEYMRMNAFGNLGIGTTSPGAYLDITGTNAGTTSMQLRSGNTQSSSASTQIIFSYDGMERQRHNIKSRHNSLGEAGNAIDFYVWKYSTDADGAIGTQHVMTIAGDNGGSVGIGTPIPAEELHVVGNIRMVDGNQAANKVMVSDANGTGSWTDATSLTITETDPQVSSATTNQIPKWNGTTLTDGIVTDNGTNVGVGSTSPAAKLDVIGTARATDVMANGTSGNLMLSNSNTSATDYFRIDGNADKLYVIAESGASGSVTGTEIRFRTATTNATATDKVTINNNGNVGINTTSPNDKLHVVGNIRMVDGNQALGKVIVSDANGTASWSNAPSINILRDADNDTKVQVEESADEDKIRFDLGGIEHYVMTDGRLEVLNTGHSIYMGQNAGPNDDGTSNNNIGIGVNALANNISGGGNVAIGSNTLTNSNTSDNTAIGENTLTALTSGQGNTIIGKGGFQTNSTGSFNTSLGLYAGYYNTGSSNVFLGHRAGQDETGSNKLYIDNTNTSSPLIYGDFSTNELNIMGELGIGTATPAEELHVVGNIRMVDGNQAANKVMVSDANGTASWAAASTLSPNKIIDADADTKIQVEESADEDKIRFDMAGTEYLVMSAGRLNVLNTGGSTFLGSDAGLVDDLSANYNTFLGYFSGKANTTGDNNVAVGAGSLESNVSGSGNTSVGRMAMLTRTSGSDNTALGREALYSNVSGTNNTALGSLAGSNATGSGNVFIGYKAGEDETGNNKLYIDNSDITTPLIYGDFSTDEVTINGEMGIGINPPAYDLDIYKTEVNVNQRVYSNDALGIGHLLTGANGGGHINLVANSSVATYLGVPVGLSGVVTDYTDMVFATGTGGTATEQMRITTSGSVGIGTGATAPAAPLHISVNNASSQVLVTPSSTSGQDAAVTVRGARNGSTSTNQAQLKFENYDVDLSASNTMGTIVGKVTNSTTNVGDLVFNTSSDGTTISETMRLTSGGMVGIGSNNPTQAKLVVNGSQNSNPGAYGYLNNSAPTGTNAGGTNPYSIYASARIAATEFNAYSDERIKNINGISNSSNDLKTLMGIEITDYTFIDKVEKGDVVQKKVIAQQVEKIYPQAVSKITDVVPDIYKIAEINAGRITVANNLKAGEKVKLIFENRTELVEVNDADENGFSVNLPDNGKVFVFGREVNDFRTVDYEALSTLNISATQELVKMINQLKTENTEMKNRFSALSSDVEMLKTMLNAGTKAEK